MDTSTAFQSFSHDNVSSIDNATNSTADNDTGDYGSYYGFDDYFDWHTESVIPTVPFLALFDVIALLGVIGNVMILVVLRHPSLCSFSYSVYLRFLAVSDMTVILFYVMQVNLDRFYNIYQRMLTWHLRFCQTFMLLRYWSSFLSVWLVVVITCDRFMAVVFPLRRKVASTKKKVTVTCIVLVVLTFLYNLSHYYITDMVPDEFDPSKLFCSFSKDTRVVADTLNLICGSLLPCFLIFFINMLTLFYIRLSARHRDELTASSKQHEQPRPVVSIVSEDSQGRSVTMATEQSCFSTTDSASKGVDIRSKDEHVDGKVTDVQKSHETKNSVVNDGHSESPPANSSLQETSYSVKKGATSESSVPTKTIPSKLEKMRHTKKGRKVDRATVSLTYISVSAFLTVAPYSIMHGLFMVFLDQWDAMLAVNPFTPMPMLLQNLVRAWDLVELIFLLNFCQNFYILLLTNRLVFQAAGELFGFTTGKKSSAKLHYKARY